MVAATLFFEIKKASEVLSDPAQRAAFDQQRTARMQREDRFKKLDSDNQKRRLGTTVRVSFVDDPPPG